MVLGKAGDVVAIAGVLGSLAVGLPIAAATTAGALTYATAKKVLMKALKESVTVDADDFASAAKKVEMPEKSVVDFGDIAMAKTPTRGETESAFQYGKDGKIVGVRKNPHELRGDLDNAIVRHELNNLPDVPEGRFDYHDRAMPDMKNFQKGTAKYHSGPLKEDMVLLNFFDASKSLGSERSVAWATHPKVIEDLIGKPYTQINSADMNKICDHLGLVRPDWGARNAMQVIKIEKGANVNFVSGKAKFQRSDEIFKKFKGGGFQIRFMDFDNNWIKETFEIK